MPFTGLKPKYHKSQDLKVVRAILNSPQTVKGYSSPQQRAVLKKMMTEIAKLGERDIWFFWEKHWKKGKSFEAQNLAIYYWCDAKNFELAKKFYKPLMSWASDLDNWAHSDGLSSLYARFLEELGAPIDKILWKWNRSPNPWKRRQSVVSLLYYTRQRKKTPSAKRVLSAIETLLEDDHYYVQKGVGWTLREVYQVNPVLTMKFIERHLHRIRSHAYSAAVEKLSLTQKKRLRELRAGERRQKRSQSL